MVASGDGLRWLFVVCSGGLWWWFVVVACSGGVWLW